MTPVPVSVVMPVFNAEESINSAIDSVLAQRSVPFELVVVDDGSTDATPRILDERASCDNRIRVLSMARCGVARALNEGIDASRGELIARMDADDVMHPRRLALQAGFLQRNPGVGVVASRVTFAGSGGGAGRGFHQYVTWQNGLLTHGELYRNRFVESPLAHPSVMFRRSVAQTHGVYREGDFPEDYELWLRWFECGVIFAKIPRELVVWSDSPHRLSRADPRYRAEAFYRCKSRYLARWLQRTVSRPLYVCGAGRLSRQRAGMLGERGCRIEGYIDIDPAKAGRVYQGATVRAPSALPPPGTAFVLSYVSCRGARAIVRELLDARGFREGEDYLCCA